jgi:hypothetical protein
MTAKQADSITTALFVIVVALVALLMFALDGGPTR